MAGSSQVVVIGAGITGLACAYYLKTSGIPVVLLESSEKPGGIVSTVQQNGFLVEVGPQCPRFSPRLLRMICDLGIAGEFLPAGSRAPRYILKNGCLHKVPFSPLAFLATHLVPTRSKLRLLTEPFRRSRPPKNEESLADMVRRKFDLALLDYIVDPVVSAVFAGDPEKMGVESAFPFFVRWEREHGSLLRGAIKARGAGKRASSKNDASSQPAKSAGGKLAVTESLPPLGSFRRGMSTLPLVLAKALGDSLRLNTPVQSLEPIVAEERSSPRWRIRLSSAGEISADAVVIATPAFEASRLIGRAALGLAPTLAAFSYAPVAVVALAFERSQVRHSLDGFGFLVSRRERLNTFYTVWNSSLFPDRAPEGKILLTSFAGGARNTGFVDQDNESIARIVEREISSVLDITGSAIARFVWNHPRALPQFNIGHAARVATVRQIMARLPGVFLAGSYLDGRSLSNCVEIAFQTAEQVKRRLAP